MGECCSGCNCLHSGCTVLSYLTLTAGDKGIKCPSASPRRCREVDRQERHRLPRWLLCQLRFATACPWLHNLPPRAPGMPPERQVGGGAGTQARGGNLPRWMSCRARELVAHRPLPERGTRRGKVHV